MNKDNEKKIAFGPDAIEAEQKKILKRKRIIAIVSFVIALGVILWLGFYLTKSIFSTFENDGGIEDAAANFKNLIQSYGNVGVLVGFGIQALQVVVSPIPGEVVEVGMGLCFGWFGGTVICILGSAFAAALIMIFVKKWGIKAVELFVSREKINELRFINTEEKLSRMVFLLYLIPGTPKDPLIFFFGLTKIRILDFVIIQSIARIPSIVTSTIGGTFLVDKNYIGAILMFAITGAISLAGIFLYRKIIQKLGRKGKNKKEQVK